MSSGSNGGEEPPPAMAALSKTLKKGERILAPTRRPDGTLRKPIRIRAGYVPQDEVAKYQSKGTLLKKEMTSPDVPPGYDPVLDAKPKTKSVKRNERKKEKKLQAALENGKNVEPIVPEENQREEVVAIEDLHHGLGVVESLTSKVNDLAVSSNPNVVSSTSHSMEGSNPGSLAQDIDKKIRALRKKIRLAEAQQQKTTQQDMKSEQLEKLKKLEGWHEELRLLEDKKAELTS